MQVVCYCEGGRTTFLIHQFSINLVATSAVTSQLSMQQLQKLHVEGAKAVDITVGDNFVHLVAQLGTLPWARIIATTLLVNKTKGKSIN